jgi:hypothetical protein
MALVVLSSGFSAVFGHGSIFSQITNTAELFFFPIMLAPALTNDSIKDLEPGYLP